MNEKKKITGSSVSLCSFYLHATWNFSKDTFYLLLGLMVGETQLHNTSDT